MGRTELADIATFLAVADHHGFRTAARHLGRSQPAVSRAVARLEHRLGRALIDRTSRALVLTDAGHSYADQARGILAQLDGLEQQLGDDGGRARPRLTISAAPAVARRLLVPHARALLDAVAPVQLEWTLTERFANLAEEGIDLAIRYGPLESSELRHRLLHRGHFAMYAAPGWLRRHPLTRLEQLAEVDCVVLHATTLRNRWPVLAGGQLVWQAVRVAHVTNDAETMIGLAAAGFGVIVAPDFLVTAERAAGLLVPVLPGLALPPADVHAVMTPVRARRRVVRDALRWLAETLA